LKPNLRRKWSTIPKSRACPNKAAFHNQPSRFTACRLFVCLAYGSLNSTFSAQIWQLLLG